MNFTPVALADTFVATGDSSFLFSVTVGIAILAGFGIVAIITFRDKDKYKIKRRI